MTTIYLLRHGEIESDGPRRLIGQSDVRLGSRGLEQARIWRDAFAETCFDAIYASDLSRCAETARIIASRTSAEVQFLPELREIELGKLEGLTTLEVRERYRDEWEARGNDVAGYVPDGGESFADLQQRVIPAVDAICRDREIGSILVVSHAGVNRVILCHALGMPLGNLFRIPQDCGCLNVLEHSGGQLRVRLINRPCPEGRSEDRPTI